MEWLGIVEGEDVCGGEKVTTGRTEVLEGEYREWIEVRYPEGADGAVDVEGVCMACLRGSDGRQLQERLLERGRGQ